HDIRTVSRGRQGVDIGLGVDILDSVLVAYFTFVKNQALQVQRPWRRLVFVFFVLLEGPVTASILDAFLKKTGSVQLQQGNHDIVGHQWEWTYRKDDVADFSHIALLFGPFGMAHSDIMGAQTRDRYPVMPGIFRR